MGTLGNHSLNPHEMSYIGQDKLPSIDAFSCTWTIKGACILLSLCLVTNKCQIFNGSNGAKYVLLLCVFLNCNLIQKDRMPKYHKKSHEHGIANKAISIRNLFPASFSLCFLPSTVVPRDMNFTCRYLDPLFNFCSLLCHIACISLYSGK